jgi:deoxyribonuclease V
LRDCAALSILNLIVMKALRIHRWNVTPREARDIQLRIRDRIELRDRVGRIQYVAGADLAFRLPHARSWETGAGSAIAGVVVFRYPSLEEVERVWIEQPLTFPYVPGLLSFREIPALIAAFSRLRTTPDLIFVDGHGFAHPRRLGIASHLGIVLDTPTIGCAKSVLVGSYEEPARTAGSWTPLLAPALASGKTVEKSSIAKTNASSKLERIGAALRTRDSVNPIFVSQGHRISLARAIKLTLAVCDGFRIPLPTRAADHFVGAVKRGEFAEFGNG